ncbi:MAG: 16S rRNA (guanine(527)-N(7))-methyltransferase RsmG [Pirellulales bacterium]
MQTHHNQPKNFLADAIRNEIQQLGLDLPDKVIPALAAYAKSLWAWNDRLNLTRHTEVQQFVQRDVTDTAAICPHMKTNERVLDVGTGGGVPGVLLTILRSDLTVELSDTSTKRIAALKSILDEIGLSLTTHHKPAQQVVLDTNKKGRSFDTLVVRAVAPLHKLLTWFEPISSSYGRLLVIKGPRWESEKQESRHRGFLKKVTARRIANWPIPGSDTESVLLEIKRRKNSR